MVATRPWNPLLQEPLVEIPNTTKAEDDPFGFGSCRVVDDVYEREKQIGEGTYGQVYLARDKRSGEKVALKKIRLDNEKGEGFPVTAIREILILKDIAHENIINLKEIVRSDVTKSNQFKGSIFMVLDYMEHDLTGLMERQKHFTAPQVKLLLYQLLQGLNHCHECGILHRDLKGSNLLIDNNGRLKLADFGLARNCREALHLTNRTITLWYRPPELLLGAEQYRQEVDMWSVGCIFAELLTGQALFPGKDETDQLERIFMKLGTPDEDSWPGINKLPFYKMLNKKTGKNSLREEFIRNNIHPTAVDLLCKLLTLNPASRLTGAEALASEYFRSEPKMCVPEELPQFEDSHEWEMKQRHRRKRDASKAGQPLPMSPQAREGTGSDVGAGNKRPRSEATQQPAQQPPQPHRSAQQQQQQQQPPPQPQPQAQQPQPLSQQQRQPPLAQTGQHPPPQPMPMHQMAGPPPPQGVPPMGPPLDHLQQSGGAQYLQPVGPRPMAPIEVIPPQGYAPPPGMPPHHGAPQMQRPGPTSHWAPAPGQAPHPDAHQRPPSGVWGALPSHPPLGPDRWRN